jgi:Tfp pilus assembly protein PilN
VESEQEAARLRTQAAAIRAQINAKELETVASAAREANGIIDQRAFSWTELLGRFEQTLPENVRITAVQPRLTTNGTFVVGMTVQARRAEDLDAFIEALEKTGAFRDATPVEEQTNEQGLLEAVIEATYINEGAPRG